MTPKPGKFLKDRIFLVVDDNADNLNSLGEILRFYGGTVHFAAEGKQCLAMIPQVQPHVIMLDLAMPVMNGWEVMQAIRANEAMRRLIVIAVTAHALQRDYDKIIAQGFDGYLAKPYQLEQLTEELQRVLADVPVEIGMPGEADGASEGE
jgi:CheY-like chemotaxis protein